MKKLLIIVLLIGVSLCFGQEKRKWFEYGKTHLGLESDLIQYLTVDMITGQSFSSDGSDVTHLTGVDINDGEDYFDDYWSIQYTLKDKWIVRYSSFDKNENISGMVGPDQGYIIDNGDSPQHNYSYYDMGYIGSGKQMISRIISVGYPFKLKTFKPSIWTYNKEYQLDVIILLGLSFNKINKMDVYTTKEWIGSEVYFWDSTETVEWTETTNDIKPSIGISLPIMGYFQSSIIYNGHYVKLMFGCGI